MISIIIKFGELCVEFLQELLMVEKLYQILEVFLSIFKHLEVGLKKLGQLPFFFQLR